MKKFVKKLKALIKKIDWKKVGITLGLIVVSAIAVKARKRVVEMLVGKILNSTRYGTKIYNEAVSAANEDGLTERFNKIWDESHPDFDALDENQIAEQSDAFERMFKPYLDTVAKKHAIGGKMLDFDETEPILLKVIDPERELYEVHINAVIKNVD